MYLPTEVHRIAYIYTRIQQVLSRWQRVCAIRQEKYRSDPAFCLFRVRITSRPGTSTTRSRKIAMILTVKRYHIFARMWCPQQQDKPKPTPAFRRRATEDFGSTSLFREGGGQTPQEGTPLHPLLAIAPIVSRHVRYETSGT